MASLLLKLLSVLLPLAATHVTFGSRNETTTSWKTLTGARPLIVAHGGFSGIYPDSSAGGYVFARAASLSDSILWCDLQLTQDAEGFCFHNVDLEYGSDIVKRDPTRRRSYPVNKVLMTGFFSVDYKYWEIRPTLLIQNISSRNSAYNGAYRMLLLSDLVERKLGALWLNVQHDAFYTQHNLSMRNFVINNAETSDAKYISSPEINFLLSIRETFRASTTKLILRILKMGMIEPSTQQEYGFLVKNLSYIKTFASGILVPKSYIWPEDHLYLQPYTSLVMDAHKIGLEVFASDFRNDAPIAYNYSFDPLSEYLNFVDNGVFSVDGVLSDYPTTPSAALDCFSHLGTNQSENAKFLIISSEGASGDFPGCTDMAYNKAVSDGADIIDCPVQITSDGVPICLGSINLLDRTTVSQSEFTNLSSNNPELQSGSGIYTFSLTWTQIQSLRPSMYEPFAANNSLHRNPNAQYVGNYMTLYEFLGFASKAASISGVLINIKHAAYLAKNHGLNVTKAVMDSLYKSNYDNKLDKKILIQSSEREVLKVFKILSDRHWLVYEINKNVRDVLNSTILQIKEFAHAVILSKDSIYPREDGYLIGENHIVPKFHDFKLQVYVQKLTNEFVSLAWDFLSDPYFEIGTYVKENGVDGIITDFPATSSRYRRSKCLQYRAHEVPVYAKPVRPGVLFGYTPSHPAVAPSPVMTDTDLDDQPIPPIRKSTSTIGQPPVKFLILMLCCLAVFVQPM